MIDDTEAGQAAQFLDDFGDSLMKDLREAIAWRKKYEQRCLEAENQIRTGRTELTIARGTKETGGVMSPELRVHEKGTDNQTAPIWRKMNAKIGQMLFGTDEIQADIEPSPKATAQSFAAQPDPTNPQSPTLAQIADKAAESMETTIKDYLAEADYARHGREVIAGGTGVGIGIMYGPYPKKVVEKIGQTTALEDGSAVMQFELKSKTVPSVEALEWRRFYPKPCRTMAECDGVFMLTMMTKKQLEKLKEDQTCNAEQIDRIIQGSEVKNPMEIFSDSPMMSANGELSATMKGKFPVWKFFGTMPSKCLPILHGGEDKYEKDIDAEVHFCNGITFKAEPRDGETSLPFQTYSWMKDPDSVFGYGVPHAMADDQHDINLAWAAMKLSARATAMPIVGWDRSALDPDQGQIEWPPARPIDFEAGTDLGKAIQQINVATSISETAQAYAIAKSNALEHTLSNSVEQDAPARSDIGASMFAMLKIEQNVVTADAAIAWDDNITKPLFQAMIDFELLYGKDKANKGAFDVVPKAASHLLTKDIQIQQAMQVLTLAANPTYAAFFDPYELNKLIVSRTNLPVDQIMVTKEQAQAIQQQQAQQPNPEMMKLEMQMKVEEMKAANALEVAKIKANTDMLVAEASLEAASITAASDEVMTTQEQESRVRIAELSTRLKAQAELLKDERERQKTAAQTTLEAQKLASKEAGDRLEVEVENTPRLA